MGRFRKQKWHWWVMMAALAVAALTSVLNAALGWEQPGVTAAAVMVVVVVSAYSMLTLRKKEDPSGGEE